MEFLVSVSGVSSTAWIISFSLVVVVGISWSYIKSRNDGALPPGPFCWPIVGCLFSLRSPLYRHFAKLAESYGPVIYLRIGMVPYVVVNNSEMAKELLKVHDLEFAFRPDTSYFRQYSFGYNSLGLAPYGESWRRLKKMSATHLFSSASLNGTAPFRKSETATTIRSILQLCKDGCFVNLRTLLHELNCNVLCLTLFGKKTDGINPHSAADSLVQLVEKITHLITLERNLGELFPALEWFDLHGVERKLKHQLMPQLKSVLSALVEQHRQHKAQVEAMSKEFVCKDFTDVLISLEKDDALPEITIIALLTDLFVAGIETTSVTLEWAMAEVINNPEVMLRAQEEIDKVVGKLRFVQESDLPNLPYLQAVLKETLRLHSPSPLGAPHLNPNAATLAGYKIPAKCKVLVNIWAIGRDPKYWSQPEEFKPERFMGSEINLIGQHFQLLPFSEGRRMCAGYPLALRSIPFILATLLQAFDWTPPPGQSTIDMKHEEGIEVHRFSSDSTPIVVASPRLDQSVYNVSLY